MGQLELVPMRGRMTAFVFENSYARIPPTLVFSINIPVRPFEFEGEMQETSVRLDRFRFWVRDWPELFEREFRFPKNPQPGYVDGSIYLGDAHNPADITRIRFGKLQGNLLPAALDVEFDFTYEGPGYLGKFSVTWQVELMIDLVELDKTIAEAKKVVTNWER